jgi:hypothetical protein
MTASGNVIYICSVDVRCEFFSIYDSLVLIRTVNNGFCPAGGIHSFDIDIASNIDRVFALALAYLSLSLGNVITYLLLFLLDVGPVSFDITLNSFTVFLLSLTNYIRLGTSGTLCYCFCLLFLYPVLIFSPSLLKPFFVLLHFLLQSLSSHRCRRLIFLPFASVRGLNFS